MKAVIIGAGIGGLTTAIALEKQGIDVEIYEKSSAIKAVGAGLSIWKNALIVLEALGLGEALQQHTVSNGEGGIHSHTGENLATMQQNSDDVLAVVIHRADLHDLLLEACKSPIHLGKSVSRYENQSDGAIAYFEDGTSATADILIAADGIHSVIRCQMFPESHPIYAGYTAFRGIVDFDHARLNGLWGESWGIGLRFGITPLSGNRVYWFCTDNADQGQSYDTQARQQHILDLYADWHEPIADLISETPPEAILQHDVYDIAPLASWQDGHVILLGDAAHAMTPNLGQGACQAIEDAYALAHCLSDADNIQQGIADYQRLRIPRAKQIMTQSRQIGKVGQLENSILCWGRNQFAKLVPDSIRTQGLNAVIQYDITKIMEI